MSIGMIALIILSLLILFGAAQRVLDRMALTDRQALLVVSAIFVGGWLPEIDLGLVTLNIGGAVIPLILCVYLLLRADSSKERIRTQKRNMAQRATQNIMLKTSNTIISEKKSIKY